MASWGKWISYFLPFSSKYCSIPYLIEGFTFLDFIVQQVSIQNYNLSKFSFARCKISLVPGNKAMVNFQLTHSSEPYFNTNQPWSGCNGFLLAACLINCPLYPVTTRPSYLLFTLESSKSTLLQIVQVWDHAYFIPLILQYDDRRSLNRSLR